MAHVVTLKDGKILEVERSFETVIVYLTHWRGRKGGKPEQVRDRTRAGSLEQAILGAFDGVGSDAEAAEALELARAEPWGATLP